MLNDVANYFQFEFIDVRKYMRRIILNEPSLQSVRFEGAQNSGQKMRCASSGSHVHTYRSFDLKLLWEIRWGFFGPAGSYARQIDRPSVERALCLKKRVPPTVSPLFQPFTKAKSVPERTWAVPGRVCPVDLHTSRLSIFMFIDNSKSRRLTSLMHFLREELLPQRFWELSVNEI
jgi:hypothetical protein